MNLEWKTSASGMLLTQGSEYTYTIFRNGDSGYWTLGRTHKDEGVMVTLWSKFATVEAAEDYAQADYDVQMDVELEGEDPPEPTKAS
jgi:hypothetical protein